MTTPWHESTGSALANHVVDLGRRLWKQDSSRRSRMIDQLSRFEGCRLKDLDPRSYRDQPLGYEVGVGDDEMVRVRWNLCRSITDAAVNKVAGTQQPKVQFVCSNADWKTRRRGPKLDNFIEGLWGQRQEPYADIYELFAAAFRDAAVCEMGFVRIESDQDMGKVLHTKPYPWELVTDPIDASRGNPQHLWHIYGASRDQLKAWYPERAEDIDGARLRSPQEDRFTGAVDNQVVENVWCFEWWSLPQGPESPGKHVLALDGGGEPLIEDDWTRESFPFAIVRWSRAMVGWGGTSLVSEVSEINDEMNAVLARMSRAIDLTSMATIFAPEASGLAEKLKDNADCKVHTFTGVNVPTMQNAEPISPTHVNWVQMQKAAAYEISGVPQQMATAQKSPGITAASAIQLEVDIQSERFSIAWKALQAMAVETARHDIACVRDLAKDHKDFAAKWPGNGFLKTIKWADVDLAYDLYTIRIAEAPGVKGSPQARQQTAIDMYGSGMMSADSYMAVQRYLDLPGELDRMSRVRNLVDSYIERWSDITEDEYEAGKFADGVPLYPEFPPGLRIEDMLLQVADAYVDAMLQFAPDLVKECMIRFLEIADGELTKRQAKIMAAQAAQAAPAPMPAGPIAPPPPGGPLA